MNKLKNYSRKWIAVKPAHCHQRFLRNTLVNKIRCLSKDKIFAEIAFKFIPQDLPFFFDHHIDHLPGMLTVNAMRQGTLALAHLLYDIPIDFIALLDWMNIKSFNYGELRAPTIAKSKLLECARNKHKITLILDGIMMQGDYPIMRATGKLIMLSPALASKIRHKKTKDRDNNWTNK